MLKSLKLNRVDPFLEMIHKTIGDGTNATEVEEGIFKCGHFNFEDYVKDQIYTFSDNWDRRDKGENVDLPEELSEYGVADDLENFKEVYKPIIEDKDRNFIVSITPIRKSDQPDSRGWRWHKWGPYIGNKNPQHEYLYDEDDSIREVIVFHVYEIKK